MLVTELAQVLQVCGRCRDIATVLLEEEFHRLYPWSTHPSPTTGSIKMAAVSSGAVCC